jgi:hypothetical protein
MFQRFFEVKPCPNEMKCDVEVFFAGIFWVYLIKISDYFPHGDGSPLSISFGRDSYVSMVL